MPRIKSSIKDVRKNRQQRAINRTVQSRVKTALRKSRTSSPEQRAANYAITQKIIDKAVQSGHLHRNTGARYKSRLAKAVVKAAA